MTQVSGTSFYRLHRPSRCPNRLRYHARGLPADESGPLEEILTELGKRHEAAHFATLPGLQELASQPSVRTAEALQRHEAPLGHALLTATWLEGGTMVEAIGEPDLLIPQDAGWIVRDVKLTRRIPEHPEVAAQINFYGALLEESTGTPPVRLEVVLGNGLVAERPYQGLPAVKVSAAEIADILATDPVYEPVGWTKCDDCPYRTRCWSEAENTGDVALLPDVDQNLSRALHDRGVHSIATLRESFTVDELAEFKRPWGDRLQKVGKKAALILTEASPKRP